MDSSIHVVATLTPVPEKKDRCQRLLLDVVSNVEQNEPDTLRYQFFWVESSGEFLFLECYKSEEAFREHQGRTYIRELQELAIEEELLTKPLEVKVFSLGLGGFAR